MKNSRLRLPDGRRGLGLSAGTLGIALVSYLYFRLGYSHTGRSGDSGRSHLMRTIPGFSGSEDALLASDPRRNDAEPVTRDEAP